MSDDQEPAGAKVIPIEAAMPHFSAELICLGCHHRAVHVWPQQTLLRSLECSCGKVGLLIATGQPARAPEADPDDAG